MRRRARAQSTKKTEKGRKVKIFFTREEGGREKGSHASFPPFLLSLPDDASSPLAFDKDVWRRFGRSGGGEGDSILYAFSGVMAQPKNCGIRPTFSPPDPEGRRREGELFGAMPRFSNFISVLSPFPPHFFSVSEMQFNSS